MKFFVNLASFSWVVFLYLLQNRIFLFESLDLNGVFKLEGWPVLSQDIVNTAFYLLVCIALGCIGLFWLRRVVDKKTTDNLQVEKIYPVYTEYMPIYLAICVIAFELNSVIEPSTENLFTTLVISLFIFIVFYISNIAYLNPVWYVLGKRVYKVEREKGNYIVIMDKSENYKSIDKIDSIVKVDEYVFMKIK